MRANKQTVSALPGVKSKPSVAHSVGTSLPADDRRWRKHQPTLDVAMTDRSAPHSFRSSHRDSHPHYLSAVISKDAVFW